MIEELIRTRCTAAWFVITDHPVRIERKSVLGADGRLDVLPRQTLVGVDMENKMPPVFARGGASTLIFGAMEASWEEWNEKSE